MWGSPEAYPLRALSQAGRPDYLLRRRGRHLPTRHPPRRHRPNRRPDSHRLDRCLPCYVRLCSRGLAESTAKLL